MKTEQRKKNLRVKQGNREVFQMRVWKVARLIVEQHRKVRVKAISQRKLLCEACIIQRREQIYQDCSTGQAIKSARGMPWHQEPMKDVTSCDKPREGANDR